MVSIKMQFFLLGSEKENTFFHCCSWAVDLIDFILVFIIVKLEVLMSLIHGEGCSCHC